MENHDFLPVKPTKLPAVVDGMIVLPFSFNANTAKVCNFVIVLSVYVIRAYPDKGHLTQVIMVTKLVMNWLEDLYYIHEIGCITFRRDIFTFHKSGASNFPLAKILESRQKSSLKATISSFSKPIFSHRSSTRLSGLSWRQEKRQLRRQYYSFFYYLFSWGINN